MNKKPIPCAFFDDVQAHFQPIIDLFAGPGCWPRAVRNYQKRGLGSTLCMGLGIDALDLAWPALDRIILVRWPGCTEDRFRNLTRALIRDGGDLVVLAGPSIVARRRPYRPPTILKYLDGSVKQLQHVAVSACLPFEVQSRRAA